MIPLIRQLLPELTLFERGWLSANNLLFISPDHTTLVDSGYCTHASQTLALVHKALRGRALDTLVNTHLHSDHCGGNAALKAAYPDLQTLIPPGHAAQVVQWDAAALSYEPTGQLCPRFSFTSTLEPGGTVLLGARHWQVHAAPGHDPHSVILFEPQTRVLISADALWENGFGVVFPELEGIRAFDEVQATLTLIESLQPALIVPGHGSAFTDLPRALGTAQRRLDSFVNDPRKHALHASKVLLKYKLLELQQLTFSDFSAWAAATPYFCHLHRTYFHHIEMAQWVSELVGDLQRTNAARREGAMVYNAGG